MFCLTKIISFDYTPYLYLLPPLIIETGACSPMKASLSLACFCIRAYLTFYRFFSSICCFSFFENTFFYLPRMLKTVVCGSSTLRSSYTLVSESYRISSATERIFSGVCPRMPSSFVDTGVS